MLKNMRCCYECKEDVNGFHYRLMAAIVDKENDRVAYSRLETVLCVSDFYKIFDQLKEFKELESGFYFAIDSVVEKEDGSFKSVQEHKFLEKSAADKLLKKSAEILFKKPGTWGAIRSHGKNEWIKDLKWAKAIYDKLWSQDF